MGKIELLKNIDVGDIDEIDKNAHYMEKEMFHQLVENVRADGYLSSVPLCIPKGKDRYEVISGNHRVKAAKMAGVSQIHILVEHGLTLAEKRAKQISQNTLVGKDDEQILRELLSDISDAEEKRYAFVNEEYLKSVTDFDYDIVQPTHEIVNYNLTFFEPDERYFKQVCEQVEEATSAEEETILLPKPAMDKFLEISGEISTKYKIKSLSIALLKMAELSQLAIENGLDQNGKE